MRPRRRRINPHVPVVPGRGTIRWAWIGDGPPDRVTREAGCREWRNPAPQATEPAWQRFLEEVEAFLPGTTSAPKAFAELTPRERDLLELLAQGRDNAQIAATLTLSEKTVRNHITHIFAKLEVESRAQAIVLARNAGYGRT